MSIDQTVLPLICPCLSQEECITQSLVVLDKFKKEFGNFIANIHKQVDSRTERLSNIQKRILKVNERINKVHNSKKAIQAKSPASFPRTCSTPRNNFIVNPKNHISSDLKYKLSAAQDSVSSSTRVLKFTTASFDLFHQRVVPPEFSEGIGIPPRDMNSTANLLIFNTSINPYKEYSVVDPLNYPVKTTCPKLTERGPAQAPETVALGQQFNLLQKLNFDYNPILGDVPQIEVPDSLPELTGIVTDLNYSADQNEPGIAPSIILTDIAVDLPEMDSEVIDSMVGDPNITSTFSNVPVLTPQSPSQPQNSTPVAVPVQEVTKEVTFASEVIVPQSTPKEEITNPCPPPMESSMKSFLDSIVNAGGSEKFRFKAKKEEEPHKSVSVAKEVVEPDDMMSQLRKVLKRRGESLRGPVPVIEVPRPPSNEPTPFVKSISNAIKLELSEDDEIEDNWSD